MLDPKLLLTFLLLSYQLFGLDHSQTKTARTKADKQKQSNPNTVAIVYYGRHTDPSGEDWFRHDLEGLKACGITPRIYDDLSPEALAAQIKKDGLKNTTYLFSGHGTEKDGKLSIGSEKTYDANTVAAKILQEDPKAAMWLGTCHADSFGNSNFPVGRESLDVEEAPNKLSAWAMIVDLLCDNQNGDCSLWNTVDKNHDGTIEGQELAHYLRPFTGRRTARVYVETPTDEKKMKLFYSKLTHVTFSKTEYAENMQWVVSSEKTQYSGRGFKIFDPSKSQLGEFSSQTDAEQEAKKRYPLWPKDCSEGNYTRKDCTLQTIGKRYTDISWDEDGLWSPTTQKPHSENRKNYTHPQAGGFFLESPRCKVAGEKLVPPTELAKKPGDPKTAQYVKKQATKVPGPLQQGKTFEAMAALNDLVKTAQVVGLGEYDHGLRDETQIRKGMFEYLVKQHGFTHVIAESGLLEGRKVDRYIQGDPAFTSFEDVMDGFTHSMGTLAGNRDLIEWMRAYNLDPANKGKPKLHYYGMDITDRGDHLYSVIREMEPELKKYSLKQVDTILKLSEKAGRIVSLLEKEVQKATGGKVKGIDQDYLDYVTTLGYQFLTPSEKEKLSVAIQELLNFLTWPDAKESEQDTETRNWNISLGRLLKQMQKHLNMRDRHPVFPNRNKVVSLLEKIGIGTPSLLMNALLSKEEKKPEIEMQLAQLMQKDNVLPGTDPLKAYAEYFVARESREESLAQNVSYILGTDKKGLVVGANGHLSKGVNPEGSAAGTYIDSYFPKKYVSLASVSQGTEPGSLEKVLTDSLINPKSNQTPENYFIGLNEAPDWFKEIAKMRIGPAYYGINGVSRNFDGIFFFPLEAPEERIPQK